MDMMEPLDLFSALTDVDDQDVLETLDIYSRNPNHRKFRKTIAVVAVLIILASAGVVTHWLLQRKTESADKEPETDKIYTLEDNTPTPSIVELDPTLSIEEPICSLYQFMLWGKIEYIASVEYCDRIGAKIGTAKVRNEEKESEMTLYKDVIIYEIVGMDTAIAVLVYYPEDQEYYVYYNSTY